MSSASLTSVPSTVPALSERPREAFRPKPISDFQEAGLNHAQVEGLILKFLLNIGVASGRRIADELRLKRTPQLTFQYDPSVEQGVRMSKLIDDLVTDHDDAEG